MIVKLSSPTIHAIHILKYLKEYPDDKIQGQVICRNINVTQSYFMHIAKDLRSAGLMDSAQGRMGGFYLSRRAESISLYDVVKAIERDPQEYMGIDELASILQEMNQVTEEKLRKVNLSML